MDDHRALWDADPSRTNNETHVCRATPPIHTVQFVSDRPMVEHEDQDTDEVCEGESGEEPMSSQPEDYVTSRLAEELSKL